MNCARLNLQERSKKKSKVEELKEQPRRYCQKRMVDPGHEEDPRWFDAYDRFHCNVAVAYNEVYGAHDNIQAQHTEDLVLTVQTLKFQGQVDQTTRPRTSFKYIKNPKHTHRMFIKKPLSDNGYNEDDRCSELTNYFFDDYVKYLYNSDRSRPASGKSSPFLNAFHPKATKPNSPVKSNKNSKPLKTGEKLNNTTTVRKETVAMKELSEPLPDTRISYQKSGKRKSLTISRAQSPETMQVIRVDVICNAQSSMSYDDDTIDKTIDGVDELKINSKNIKNSHFNKYLLTNTVRALDESLSNGSKVTLLCKTFKLSDRSIPDKPSAINNRTFTKVHKRAMKNYNKVKKPAKSNKDI